MITDWLLPILEGVAISGFGVRYLYLASNVDQLESSGKLPAEEAARIRKRPVRLAGWLLVLGGIATLESLISKIHCKQIKFSSSSSSSSSNSKPSRIEEEDEED